MSAGRGGRHIKEREQKETLEQEILGLNNDMGYTLDESKFLIGEDEQEDYISRLLRGLGTLGRQQQAGAAETAAYKDMPLASELAGQRSAGYATLLRGQEGIGDINEMIARENRQGGQTLEGMKLQRYLSEEQMKLQKELAEMEMKQREKEAQRGTWEKIIPW